MQITANQGICGSSISLSRAILSSAPAFGMFMSIANMIDVSSPLKASEKPNAKLMTERVVIACTALNHITTIVALVAFAHFGLIANTEASSVCSLLFIFASLYIAALVSGPQHKIANLHESPD